MMSPMVSLIELLLPPACAGCGRSAGLLCTPCRAGIRAPFDPADRFVAPDAGVVTGEALAVAVAAFAYEGTVRRALAALKYTGVSRLASILAELAHPRLLSLVEIAGPTAALVPVPVHPDRQRERGYNQAGLLAMALGRQVSLPVSECLSRPRRTEKQHRLNRTARLQNLRGAFSVTAAPPAVVILVDDIITTAATLEACASLLREAGTDVVLGLAIAREV